MKCVELHSTGRDVLLRAGSYLRPQRRREVACPHHRQHNCTLSCQRPRATQSASHCERTLGRGTPCNLAVPPTGPRCQCQSAQAAPAEGYRRRSPSQSPPPATRCRSTASWPSWLVRRQHRSGSGSQRDFVGGTVAGPWASCRIASAAGATVTVPTAHGRRWHSLNMPQTLL